jgi:hypothetical protein
VNGWVQIEGVSRPVQFAANGLDVGIAWTSEFDPQGLGFVVFQ